MRTVLLDKNAGSKKLRDSCNEEGAVRCVLLPRLVRDSSGESVLNFAIANGYLTLTFDRPMMHQSGHVLAGRNPGMLLLRMDDSSVQRISTKTAPKLLHSFKTDFPEWHSVPWANSIVELTPTLVHVHHTATAPPLLVAVLKREEAGWQAELKQLLENHGAVTTD
jgi:hypothetical protein